MPSRLPLSMGIAPATEPHRGKAASMMPACCSRAATEVSPPMDEPQAMTSSGSPSRSRTASITSGWFSSSPSTAHPPSAAEVPASAYPRSTSQSTTPSLGPADGSDPPPP
ncbi:hypothetical protein ACFFX0_14305 [Citricoccus parietis]|uniref:Uncharacterized protein n=1 Tax=Citricoccus parietis TaxID=592307 RepID=A0ABV5G052_9MICC